VELPLVAEAGEAAPPAAAPRPRSGALQLLLVEDDPVVAEVIAGLLQAQGHQLRHVPHGLAALAELDCRQFDLGLLDLDLPGIDGLQLARLIRARGHELSRIRAPDMFRGLRHHPRFVALLDALGSGAS
jgi:CheY-like chemotaxis protein